MSAYAVLLSYLSLGRNIIGKGLSASSRLLQNALVPQVNIIAVSEADITIYRALMSAGLRLHKYRFQRSCFSAILRFCSEAVIVQTVNYGRLYHISTALLHTSAQLRFCSFTLTLLCNQARIISEKMLCMPDEHMQQLRLTTAIIAGIFENMKMIVLHLAESVRPIVIITEHIIAFSAMKTYTELYTTDNTVFHVLETPEEIAAIIDKAEQDNTESSFDSAVVSAKPSWYFSSIDQFLPGLPPRISVSLMLAGIKTVGQLVRLSEEDLSKKKNIGDKAIAGIKKALNEKGLSLKMTEADLSQNL